MATRAARHVVRLGPFVATGYVWPKGWAGAVMSPRTNKSTTAPPLTTPYPQGWGARRVVRPKLYNYVARTGLP